MYILLQSRYRGFLSDWLSSASQGHAKPTSHPPELVLNHFATPLGLSLATLLSQLFLPPSQAAKLQRQGFQGRQVVLAQNSRDFVFVRRYRYMFALKSHRLGKTKKQSDVARITEPNPEDEIDDTVKTRFQEIGPQFTLKMRWIRRGQLGETGHEREAREKHEAATGEQATEYGERAEGGDGEDDELAGGGAEDEEGMAIDDEDIHDEEEDDDAEAEAAAKKAIGFDETDAAGQPNFTNLENPTAAIETEAAGKSAFADEPLPSSANGDNSKKRPRSTPRVRKKPYHALLNPPPDSDSDSPEPEAVPLPMAGKKKNPELKSAFDTVGHTWHAGKGEGGVREGAKRREWNWDVSRNRRFAAALLRITDIIWHVCRLVCKSRGASSSFERGPSGAPAPLSCTVSLFFFRPPCCTFSTFPHVPPSAASLREKSETPTGNNAFTSLPGGRRVNCRSCKRTGMYV
jgi:ribosome production factor 1